VQGILKGGKYHCTIKPLFDWFGIICITTDNFCFYLQNSRIQTSQKGGQQYSDTSPFSIPWFEYGQDWGTLSHFYDLIIVRKSKLERLFQTSHKFINSEELPTPLE
jgi:hypothetical protein